MRLPEKGVEYDRIREIIENALAEDLGGGDVTTCCIVPEGQRLRGRLVAKEAGLAAGLSIAGEVFKALDGKTDFVPAVAEGERVLHGQELAVIEGSARSILSAERTALNILQRMSGIATETRKFVKAAEGTDAIILDTRKTAPGLRILDKLAVETGGGRNHRFGLFDMVLIKENHIVSAGGISEAVERVRRGAPEGILIEVEVKNLHELRETLELGVDRILLDNMSDEQMRQAVVISDGRIPLEASGNVSLERTAKIAAAGVDFISVGSLTHSVRALDISLLLEPQREAV